jgi:hypothetical protein
MSSHSRPLGADMTDRMRTLGPNQSKRPQPTPIKGFKPPFINRPLTEPTCPGPKTQTVKPTPKMAAVKAEQEATKAQRAKAMDQRTKTTTIPPDPALEARKARNFYASKSVLEHGHQIVPTDMTTSDVFDTTEKDLTLLNLKNPDLLPVLLERIDKLSTLTAEMYQKHNGIDYSDEDDYARMDAFGE